MRPLQPSEGGNDTSGRTPLALMHDSLDHSLGSPVGGRASRGPAHDNHGAAAPRISSICSRPHGIGAVICRALDFGLVAVHGVRGSLLATTT